MARVTVEDCILKVPNRFELVMSAAQRSRNISAGMPLTVERDNDKNPVIALREIAEETIDLGELEESLIKGLQKHVEYDEPVEEELDLIALHQELTSGTSRESEAIGNASEIDENPEDVFKKIDELNAEEEAAEDILTIEDEGAADLGGEVMLEMTDEADSEEK